VAGTLAAVVCAGGRVGLGDEAVALFVAAALARGDRVEMLREKLPTRADGLHYWKSLVYG